MSMKSENILNPHSCWNKAEDDEPIFVLRANDPNASANVILWAQQYLSEKGGLHRMTLEQVRKYEDALAVAQSMRNWAGSKLKASGVDFDDDIPF